CRSASNLPFKKSPGNTSGLQSRRFLALFFALSLALSTASAQTKKKTPRKPKAPPCRVGCKPDTTTPDVITGTAEHAAANKELSVLARDLHNAGPGAYEKLSAFAGKHAADLYGARASLALGYADYQKNRGPQALAWFAKAQKDDLLREYVLFWSAQTKR